MDETIDISSITHQTKFAYNPAMKYRFWKKFNL